jgi:hypothetical protein
VIEALRFTAIEKFAVVDEPGAEPLATTTDGGVVIPAGGTVLVFGAGGAGKTTLVLDLCVALAAEGSWLGLIETPPDRPLRIALIENEGPRPEFRGKLRAKLKATTPELDGRVVVLEELWAELTLVNGEHRRALAQSLVDHEIDLLVIGPLVSAGEFPTGGTPDEIRRFEQHVAELRRLADRPLALLLIHHENRSGQPSGAWERVPDTLMHVTAQGNGRTRIFWQKARWATSLHGTTTHLLWQDGETYTVERKPEVTVDTMRDDLLQAVQQHGGLSWTQVRGKRDGKGERLVRGNGTDLAALRDRLLGESLLVNVASREGRFVLWHADDPARPRSNVGTGQERLPSPLVPGPPEADPFPVPAYRGNGRNGNGPDEPPPLTDAEVEDLVLLAAEHER